MAGPTAPAPVGPSSGLQAVTPGQASPAADEQPTQLVSSVRSPTTATAPGTRPSSQLPQAQPSKLIALIYGLLGIVLLAAAGVGGWYFWKQSRPGPQPPQAVNVQPEIPKAPENPA